MSGDFWDDVQSFLDPEEFNARVGDALDQLDGSTESAVELLTGISADRQAELGGHTPDRHTCSQCGGYVRRWYAPSGDEGDVEPRAQCDSCEWGF